MTHCQLLSVLCCTAGILALLLLPILAKNTYISENALMPGSADSMLSRDDVSSAGNFVSKILSLDSGASHTGIEIQRLIAHHISDLGVEVNFHNFKAETHSFHPSRFFASSDAQAIRRNFSCSLHGASTVGIIRAPRGDGKEAIVLVTPYNSAKVLEAEALSLGIVYSVFSLLVRVTWLAKDVVWLAADTKYGEYAAVAAWLRDYHTPAFTGLQNLLSQMCLKNSSAELKMNLPLDKEIPDTFRRAGTLAAALVIKVVESKATNEKDSLKIYAEASNGQMPNLDLVNIVNYLAVHRQGLQVKVEKVQSLVSSIWLKFLGDLFESLGKIARSLNPRWNFAISTAEYVEGSSTLISSLYNQALGLPTGSHGAFRDYQVDAITVEIYRQLSVRAKSQQNEFLSQSGRLVEGTIRSVNNLLEKFHQSFFLYLLTSSNKFVSVGVYMIAFALLVAPLPLVAASLFSQASQLNYVTMKGESSQSSIDDPTMMYRSWEWLDAAKTVFLVHLWGALMIFFRYFYSCLQEFSLSAGLMLCIMFCLIILPILCMIFGSSFRLIERRHARKTGWAYLKSVTIAASFTGLCLMSVINFAAAEVGALLLVPLCLTTSPLRLKGRMFRTMCQATSNLALLLVGFPPVVFFVLKGALEGFDRASVHDFWSWMENLWGWSSGTYIYLSMVHLPCWVLCILIFCHPS